MEPTSPPVRPSQRMSLPTAWESLAAARSTSQAGPPGNAANSRARKNQENTLDAVEGRSLDRAAARESAAGRLTPADAPSAPRPKKRDRELTQTAAAAGSKICTQWPQQPPCTSR